MTPTLLRRRAICRILPISLFVVVGACNGSDSAGGGTSSTTRGSNAAACSVNANCVSNLCSSNHCVGDGLAKPVNETCNASIECASGECAAGRCTAGHDLGIDFSCAANSECRSGLCSNGACANPSASPLGQGGTASNVIGTGNTPFQGLGSNWRPLTPGCGPSTAQQCGGVCEQQPDPNAKVIRAPAAFCFGADESKGVTDPTPDDPAAMIEQVIESQNGVSYVHIRVTFDPTFVDNTYGANAHPGWFSNANGKVGKGHTFNGDLTGSDHLELLLINASGATVMSLGEDYISSLSGTTGPKPAGEKPRPGEVGAVGGTTGGSDSGPGCGYGNLGVLGGDGKMMLGDASNVLAAASSIERNLNGCGYCQSSACTASGAAGAASVGDCTTNSPLTDDKYSPNAATPNWTYAVVYEIWVKLAAFDAGGGFGQAYITFVHASPSKSPGNNTLYVLPTPCPPTWTSCPVGQSCLPNGAGGASGVAGAGNVPQCPPNYVVSITMEDNRTCTPIPFAGWPNMSACPDGYSLQIDVTDESQHCAKRM